jgi:hypothetical protein
MIDISKHFSILNGTIIIIWGLTFSKYENHKRQSYDM